MDATAPLKERTAAFAASARSRAACASDCTAAIMALWLSSTSRCRLRMEKENFSHQHAPFRIASSLNLICNPL